MEDKSATLEQAKQVLNLIAQSGASRKQLQAVYESGFLSDFLMMNPEYVSRIDRRDLRNLLGVCPRYIVEVDYNNEYYEPLSTAFRFARSPELYVEMDWYKHGVGKENVAVELIPPSLINNPVEDTRAKVLFARLKNLGYRFAAPREFIALINKFSFDFPKGKSIVGGTVADKKEEEGFYLTQFQEFKSPGFGYGMFFPPAWGERDLSWWIAAVRI
ncbi:MAG: hypothetical protein WCW78_02330 [Candidatus Paceibacterota bacterium]|jgi:hypothetical protein